MNSAVRSQISRLCDQGYQTGNVALYAHIADILATEEQTDDVVAIRRLAAAGPTLSSPRFAFPHIADRLD